MTNFEFLLPAGLSPMLADAIATIGPVHKLTRTAADEALMRNVADQIRCIVWTPFAGPLTGDFMARFPKLELVATVGAGYEHIDVVHAAERGVCVTNTPHAVTEDTADAAFALVLNTLRRFPASERYLRAGKWKPGQPFPPSASLSGKTLGILGFGRVGKAIARRAETFGLKIVYGGRTRQDDSGYAYFATPEELARNCDILLCMLPGGAATRNMIDARVLESLGPDGYFISMGRGTTVDEPALIAALRDGKIAGAGLDVYADEPNVPAELIALENVVLLPHVGGATSHMMQAVGAALLANIRSFVNGDGPLDPVAETPWRGKAR